MPSSVADSGGITSDRQTKLSPEAASSTEKQRKAETTDFKPGWRFFVALSSLSAITLMVALDATSLGNALPVRNNSCASHFQYSLTSFQKMAQLLHGTAIQAFWAGTSYLLASTILQPIIGSFSHIFGRKPLVLISVFFFAVGIIIASIANDFTIILVGRSIQGVGGGGILTMIEIVVTDLVPLRIRGQYYSMISSMWAIGSVAGPILGMLALYE